MSDEPIGPDAKLLAESFVAAGAPLANDAGIPIRVLVHELMGDLVEFYERNAAAAGSSFDLSNLDRRSALVESLVTNVQLMLSDMNLPPRDELAELALSALGAN